MAQPVIEAVSKAENDNTASTTLTLNVPSGTTDGDLLIVFLCSDGSAASGADWNEESGWSREAYGGNTASDNYIAIQTRVASSEPASYEFDYAGGVAYRRCGMMWRLSGVDTTTPVNAVSAVNALGSSTSWQAPSITTDVADCLQIVMTGFDGGDATFAVTETGWTKYGEVRSDTAGAAASFGIYTKDDTSTSGASGLIDGTFSTPDGNTVVQIAIAPSGGGGGGGSTFKPRIMMMS